MLEQLEQHFLGPDGGFKLFGELIEFKEALARIETELARGKSVKELQQAGFHLSYARILERRASFHWDDDVGVDHQDAILSALERLTHPGKRDEIYAAGVEKAQHASPAATKAYVRKLVGEDNATRAGDDGGAHKRRFHMSRPDEHGGCHISGYLPRPIAALFAALLSDAFKQVSCEDDHRRIEQRSADALALLISWASHRRQSDCGHCSLVVRVEDTAEFDWQAKFGTNVGIDLTLFDIGYLGGDNITDYITVLDEHGAIKHFATAARSATFLQRVMLLARDGCCVHPGCDAPIAWCDAHHVIPWAAGGLTTIDNLAPLCRNHHGLNDDGHVKSHVAMIQGVPWWVERS